MLLHSIYDVVNVTIVHLQSCRCFYRSFTKAVLLLLVIYEGVDVILMHLRCHLCCHIQ